MKDFEQVDVFMPNEQSKDRMKFLYSAFLAMISDMAENIKNHKEPWHVCMMDYMPEEWINLTENYVLDMRCDDNENVYIVLTWVKFKDNELGQTMPLLYINAAGDKDLSFDIDCAAYILMVTFINHLGLTYNTYMEEIDKLKKEND